MPSFSKIARSMTRRLRTQPRRRVTASFQPFGVQTLEVRRLPAQMISPTELHYQDQDGDDVVVKFSASILNAGNVNSIFKFSSGAGAVNGNTNTKEQLQRIDLQGIATAAGTDIKVTATRNAAHGGDGMAATGEIVATGVSLGAVNLDGDLGRILSDSIKSLTTQSIGRYGMTTGAVDLHTQIFGKVETLTVKGDVTGAYVDVRFGGPVAPEIGTLAINGSVIGLSGNNTGWIGCAGNIGTVTIKGDLVGSGGSGSGMVSTAGTIGAVTIGGSIRGGAGQDSGEISGFTGVGVVTITGDLIGGSGKYSGRLYSQDGAIAGLVLKGSLIGGSNDNAGSFDSNGDVGKITITGDLIGGPGYATGWIHGIGKLASLTGNGSVSGLVESEAGSTTI